jgi:transcriptional pleiotropic regulator of transition state genes
MVGIKRGVDDLGRIVIPKEFRKELNILNSDEVEMIIEGKSIRLTKVIRGCHQCGCTNEFKLKTVGNITLCRDCIKEFGE